MEAKEEQEGGDGNGNGGLTARFASGISATSSIISQTGDQNEAWWNANGNDNQFGILQNGAGNVTGMTMITGDNNQTAFVQDGDANTITAVSIMNDNVDLGASQTGNNNDISIGTLSGDSNALQLIQIGNANAMDFKVKGASNTLRAQQGVAGADPAQTGNSIIVGIAGQSNSTDYDGDMTNDDNGLFQAGLNNKLTLAVTGNSNLFKTSQSGNENEATITLTGGSNTLALSQMAAEGEVMGKNQYEITITGASNDVVSIQTGNANTLDAAITGSSNIFNTTQLGASNLMDLNINDNNGAYNLTQNGTGNILIGKVKGTGNDSQNVTVDQIGNYNVAKLSQQGKRNTVKIKQ